MASILLVAATRLEILPLAPFLDLGVNVEADRGARLYCGCGQVDLLVTGVGQMQTAFHLGQALQQERHALVLNLGIAGSFSSQFPRGSVVRVVQEELADLGAEDNGRFLDLFEMKLLDRDVTPFHGGALQCAGPDLRSLQDLPKARSITVNRVLGTAESVEHARARYQPDIVNMEGAAVFYACALSRIPCISLRSISDEVGPRDKSSWDIPGAVRAVCDRARLVLEELRSSPIRQSSDEKHSS